MEQDTYFEDREEVVLWAVNKGFSYTEIGEHLDIDPNTVYTIFRYGGTGRFMLDTKKKEYRLRLGGKCQKCGGNNKLALHHKNSPRDNSLENFALLCSNCHRKEETLIMKEVRAKATSKKK